MTSLPREMTLAKSHCAPRTPSKPTNQVRLDSLCWLRKRRVASRMDGRRQGRLLVVWWAGRPGEGRLSGAECGWGAGRGVVCDRGRGARAASPEGGAIRFDRPGGAGTMPMLTRLVRATALGPGRRRWQISASGCWLRRTRWSAPVSFRPKSRNHQRGPCLARPRLRWHHRQTPLRARRSAHRERFARHHRRVAAIWLVVRTALVVLCRQDRSWEGLASGRARQYGCVLLPRKTAAAERAVRTLARLPRATDSRQLDGPVHRRWAFGTRRRTLRATPARACS
jgi:hypothetical protein